MPSVRLCWTAVLVSLVCASSARAQSFALPIDVQQGLVIGAARPRTPYTFAIGASPAVDFGPLRAAAVIAPSYLNPRWDLALGGELSLFAPVGSKGVGLRLAVGGSYAFWQQRVRIGTGLIGEVFGLLRVGVWPGYDFDERRPVLTTSIGFDVGSWLRLLNTED
jgi:hypothetical protein